MPSDRPPVTLFVNEGAEAAALGAMLGNGPACAAGLAQLRPEDFWGRHHRDAFEAIQRMHAAGRGVDQVSIANEFPVGEMRDLVHGLPAVVPTFGNIGEYIAGVRTAARSRRLQQIGEEALRALAESNGDGPRRFLDAIAKTQEEADEADADTSAVVDWPQFWERDHTVEEWIYQDILARGRGHAIYAAHKAGKSLFTLSVAAKLATGSEPIVVLYLDYEMTEADLFERLDEMGYGPQTDLSRLRYALLPSLPPLDTAEGSVDLMRLVDKVRGDWPGHHLVVVIDTISRAVCGEENSADTFRSLYNWTGIQLKRRGATWVRLDHAGKDSERGQRGSSSKGDDVDVVWHLKQTENGITLRRQVSRMSWVPEKVTFKLTEDPLAFVPLVGDWPPGTGALANILDRLDVPLNASRREASARLREIDEGRRHELVTAALCFRRERLKEAQ